MYPRLAIPSFQRQELIQRKTLKFLHAHDYPAELIYVFVASEEEKTLYENSVPFYLYGKIVVGVSGLVQQRNFITDYFDDEEIIVCMDDDIDNIHCLNKDFLSLVKYGVTLLEVKTGGLFGIRPNNDARLYTFATTSHLAFIIGSFHIRRNHHSIRLTLAQKHDYEMSILYFLRYKKIFRYASAGVKTKYFQNPGGLGFDNVRLKNMQECVDELIKRYPLMCKSKPKKGMPDLLLNWRYKG
jgi:hypothetical protein